MSAPRAAWLLTLAALHAAPTPYPWALPPGFSPPPVPKNNPMTPAKVTLGRTLFFDARLSANGTQSCASCHRPEDAFSDPRPLALGSTGEAHRRGVPSLGNVGYRSTLTWASRAHTSLEEQARIPLFGRDPVEMGADPDRLIARLRSDPDLRRLFSAAFPPGPSPGAPDTAVAPDLADDPVTLPHLAQALASFQRTLVSGRSAYDRALFDDDPQAMTPAAWRGMTLFFSARAGCASCHGGLDLSTAAAPGFFRTEPEVGADTGLARETKLPEDRGRFRPPSLRNVAVTAPYGPAGRMATLDAVVERYVRGDAPDLRPLPLSDQERRDLVAFMESLTDPGFLTDPRHQAPQEKSRDGSTAPALDTN